MKAKTLSNKRPFFSDSGFFQKAQRDSFNAAPESSFFYPSPSHRNALELLEKGIKSSCGLALLTGEVGTGKTTLIHVLLEKLGGSIRTAFVYHTILTARDLLYYVCIDLGVAPGGRRLEDLSPHQRRLQRFLVQSHHRGKRVVLIIDEAQNLSREVLQSIHRLSCLEMSGNKLIQILLVGQPEFRVKLGLPELRQIEQRIRVRLDLQPLSFAETKEYVSQRLAVSGENPSLLESRALESVYVHSGGIPRLINILCTNAIRTARAQGQTTVDETVLKATASELGIAPQVDYFLDPPVEFETAAARGALEGFELGPVHDFEPQRMDPHGRSLNEDPACLGTPASIPLQGLVAALTEAMGPLAPIVVADHIASLGESIDHFPDARISELSARASREILNEKLRNDFHKSMAGYEGWLRDFVV